MNHQSIIAEARGEFLRGVKDQLLWFDTSGIATNADRGSKDHPNRVSIDVADHLARALGVTRTATKLTAQTQGARFERLIQDYLLSTFGTFNHLRPGTWRVDTGTQGRNKGISAFVQYQHLAYLEAAARGNQQLAAALGRDYQIGPDVVVFRTPEEDSTLAMDGRDLVDDAVATHSPLRRKNNATAILHACISCKWTLRSDRAQNVRTEALNLIRNRKGSLPHIVAVTAEPMPSRIASLALGTGDVDCVYHIALPELLASVAAAGFADSIEILSTMVEGQRLRDIADLPLDLVI